MRNICSILCLCLMYQYGLGLFFCFSAKFRCLPDERLVTLQYKHAILDEYIFLKAVRKIDIEVTVERVLLRQVTFRFCPKISTQTMPTPVEIPDHANFCFSMPSETSIGFLLDHILYVVRDSGLFSEREVTANYQQWTVTSTVGTTPMYGVKTQVLSSRVAFQDIEDQDVKEQRQQRKRPIADQ